MSTYGQIICWNVRGVFVKRSDVQNIIDELGIKLTLPKRGRAEYLKRALSQAVDEGMVRKVGESEVKVGYAVVQENKDIRTEAYNSTTQTVVVMDKATGDIRFSGDNSFTQRVYAGMQKGEGGLISYEIGSLLKRVCKNACDAISLRDTGGVYFVPQTNVAMLDALENKLGELIAVNGGTLRIQRFGVMTGAREASDLALAYTEIAAAEMMAVKAEAVKLCGELVNAKPSTFTKRAAKLTKLKKQIASYGTLLNTDFSNHLNTCDRLTQYLDKMSTLCMKKRQEARMKPAE